DHSFQTTVRQDLRPIDVVQPEGVSFQLEGNRLTWHDWSVQIGFTTRSVGGSGVPGFCLISAPRGLR
ncbi:MAG: hypothetical protein AAF196_21090, partial [Planctomycetota bacterium]